MNSRILAIGSKLDVDDDDMQAIVRKRRKGRLSGLLIKGIAPMLTLVAGFLIGVQTRPPIPPIPEHSFYPFAMAPIALGLGTNMPRKTIIGTIVLSTIAFVFAFLLASWPAGVPVYEPSIMYGVSERR